MLVFGMSAWIWLIYLPVFLLLDLLGDWIAPRSAAYFKWFGDALTAVRRGHSDAPATGGGHFWGRGVLGGLAAYAVAFVLVPPVRQFARALDGIPAVEWIYRVVDQLYPPAFKEPAHILALGHPGDAYDLRHFITMCLILSLTTLFVYTGPGRHEFVDWVLLAPVRRTVKRKSSEFNRKGLIWMGSANLLGCGGILAMFTVFGISDVQSGGYLRLEAFPSCLIFTLAAWGFSYSLGNFAIASDMDTVDIASPGAKPR
jgi:hypothetical protein